MIGKTISHYRILKNIGRGGMGVVYKAEDINLKRTVAIKFLPSSYSFDEEAKKRFIHEAQSASALDHPNICTIYEIAAAEDGQSFMSMALYEGETLKEKIAKGKMGIDEAINIALQICEGLKKAHQNKIVHRDIKPANIFITNDGIVKILDFGIAKVKGHTRLTLMGATAGTLEYMSPEQARGEEVDYRTDIWSLGTIMYEMLSGELPFKGEYDQAVIYSILNQEPDLSKISKTLIPVLRKTIAKSRNDRYQNVEGIIADLKLYRSGNRIKNHYPLSLFKRRISRYRTKLIVVASAVIALIVVSYFFTNTSLENNVTIPNRKMIVVLPFKNLGSPGDDYFAQGIREEVSNKLASFGNLGVISRNSAEKYATLNKSTKEIGKELGVDYILEGTLQWAKDKTSRVRIIPQLIRVSDDINIWSDSYDRVVSDIFNIQNEIAQKVVDKLGVKILPNQFVSGPPPTNNLDAYDYYLKAMQIKYRVSAKPDVLTSIRLYERAIALDSNFAAAYAQIAISYMGLFARYYDRDSINVKKAEKYLQKSIELNPNLADVHLAKAFYSGLLKHDDEQALKEFNTTLEIQPNNAEAIESLGIMYWNRGKFDLDLKYSLKALSLDPLASRYAESVGAAYQWQRDYKSAEKYFNRAIELTPDYEMCYARLIDTYLDWKGNTKQAWQTFNKLINKNLEGSNFLFISLNIFDRNFNEAINQLKSAKTEYVDLGSGYTPNLQMIALAYRYMHKDDLSKKYFDSSRIHLEDKLLADTTDFRVHRSLAVVYAGLNNKEKALSENKRAIELIPPGEQTVRKFVSAIDLAKIYALVGDYSNALKQIDSLLSNPGRFSVNRLKLDPLYDPLRNLPAYKEIIQKYSGEN